jgi:hypothetical protein
VISLHRQAPLKAIDGNPQVSTDSRHNNSNADDIAHLERSYLAKSGNDLGHRCQLSI